MIRPKNETKDLLIYYYQLLGIVECLINKLIGKQMKL